MPKYRRKKNNNQSKGKGTKKSNNNKQLSQSKTKQNKNEDHQLEEKQTEKSDENIAVTSTIIGVLPGQQEIIDKQEIDLAQHTEQLNNKKESEICICKTTDKDTEEETDNFTKNSVVKSKTSVQHFSDFIDSCEVNKSLDTYASLSISDKTGAKHSIKVKGEEPLRFLDQSDEYDHHHHQQQYLNVNVVNAESQDTDVVEETNTYGATTSYTIPELSSPTSMSSLSSSDSDTLKPSDTDSPDREILLTTGMMPLIDDDNDNNGISTDDDDVIHIDTSNLPICDNKNAERTTTSDNSDYKIGEQNNHSSKNEFEKPSESPIKFPIVQEVIAISYPYRVESPKPMKPEKGTTNKIKKSRSLDDNEVLIQEISDNSSAGDSTDNQAVVSEAESEIDSEVNECPSVKDNLTILSIQTLPFDMIKSKEIPKLKEPVTTHNNQQNQSTDNEDFKSRKAKKRAALESHFLPQFLNPRYLDSIKEEGSDLSDVEKKSDSGGRRSRTKSCSDLEDEVFSSDNEIMLRKADAIFPKSNLNFSQKKKHVSNLKPPKTDVIREESPCYIVEAKIVEQAIPIEENCFVWSTETVAQSDAAEIIYLDSASSSSSDIMDLDNTGADDADIEDLNDDTDVRIATPNIDIDNDERIFRKSETPTTATDESVSTISLTEAEFSDDAIRTHENRQPVEWKTNATENIFNDDNYIHHKVEKEISRGDSNMMTDHDADHHYSNQPQQHNHLDEIKDQSLNTESEIISAVIENCLLNQSQKSNQKNQFCENSQIISCSSESKNEQNYITSSQVSSSLSQPSSLEKSLKLVQVNQHENKKCVEFNKCSKSDQRNVVNIIHSDLDAENELRLLKIKEIASKCIEEIVNECESKVNKIVKQLDTKDKEEYSSAIIITNNKCNSEENVLNNRLAEVSTYVSASDLTTTSNILNGDNIKTEVQSNNIKNDKKCDFDNLEQSSNCNEILTTDLDATESEHHKIKNKILVKQFLQKSENYIINNTKNSVVQEQAKLSDINENDSAIIEKQYREKNYFENNENKNYSQNIKKSSYQSPILLPIENQIEDQTPNEMSSNSLFEPNLIHSKNKTTSTDQLTNSNDVHTSPISLTENNLNNNINNTIEYNRQDSSGSHCSDNSHSTEHSQCTAINRGSSSNIDLDIEKYISETPKHFEVRDTEKLSSETATLIKPLRQICVEKLISMPYGNVILEELASVAESLGDLANKHQKTKLTDNKLPEMPYPLPELPRINDLEVSVPASENTKIKLSSVPPNKLKSPPPPPIPEPPKTDAWLGIPTQDDPKVLVCFSPSQRNYLEEIKITNEHTSADHLLDMHKKFIERRGYHELTSKQVDAIHREKSQHNHEKNIVSSTYLRNGNSTNTPSSASSTPHSNSQQQPPPPPPLPRSNRLFNNNESEITADVKNDDKNNHRLLAIIRDSKQSPNSESISKSKIEQIVNLLPENKTKDNYRCDQETQTVPNTIAIDKTKGKILDSEHQKISSSSSTSFSSAKEESVKKTTKEENMPMNIAGEEYFKFSDDDIFDKERKRFSNIETNPNYCSQLRQTLPKRYSNVETSSYESKKCIENGNVIYEYSDSSKQKIVDGDEDINQKEKTITKIDSDKIPCNYPVMSDKNLDTNSQKTTEAPKSKSNSETISHSFKNNDTETKQKTLTDELSYEEFRQRAKESAIKARSEYFDRENFFKGFDDISKYFGDYFANKKTSEIKEISSTTKSHTIPIQIANINEGKKNEISDQNKKEILTKVHTIPIKINQDTSSVEENNKNEISGHGTKETSKVHSIPIKIEHNSNTTNEKKIFTQDKEQSTRKDEKIYRIPVIIEEQKLLNSNKSTPKKAISEQNIFHIPISLEEDTKISKSNKSSKFHRTQSLSQDNYYSDKLQEKRLSSQNLDEWLRFTDGLGASSENITKPFQKEVEILYKGRPSNVKAPRLSVSTSNLSTTETKKHDYYRPPSRTDYNFSSSQSSIDQTPITCYVSPRFPKRSSLPREIIHDQQIDYIKKKEMELKSEFEKLEQERRKLIEEMGTMRKSPQFQHHNNLRKDIYHHRSYKILPTLSEEEAFRQQMHDEWLNKVAEREERRLHKIIKISKPSDELNLDSYNNNSNERRKSSSAIDISDEFLRRVKERRSKLCIPSDSDWESGAESQPIPSNLNTDNHIFENDSKNVKVIEGQKEADLKHLPKHLREFAEFTSQIMKNDEHHQNNTEKIHEEEKDHFSTIIKDESNETTMSKVISSKTTTSTTSTSTMQNNKKDGESNESENIFGLLFAIAVICGWTIWRALN